jgi:hypothetical protein
VIARNYTRVSAEWAGRRPAAVETPWANSGQVSVGGEKRVTVYAPIGAFPSGCLMLPIEACADRSLCRQAKAGNSVPVHGRRWPVARSASRSPPAPGSESFPSRHARASSQMVPCTSKAMAWVTTKRISLETSDPACTCKTPAWAVRAARWSSVIAIPPRSSAAAKTLASPKSRSLAPILRTQSAILRTQRQVGFGDLAVHEGQKESGNFANHPSAWKLCRFQTYGDVMASPSNPVLYFGQQVRKSRLAHRWSLYELGQQIAYTAGAISRFETGKRPPTEEFAKACDRVFPERENWFHEFWKESRSWAALPSWLRDWASHESSTRTLRDWCGLMITGQLQTEAYARGASAVSPQATDDEVSAWVGARMARQQRVLLRDDPPSAWFLVDYFALLRAVAPPDAMAAQMRYLIALASMPYITIQVVYGIGHAGMLGGFTIADKAAYAESTVRGQVFEDDETIAALTLRFDTLRSSAFSAADSIELFSQAADLWTGVSQRTARRTATARRRHLPPEMS